MKLYQWNIDSTRNIQLQGDEEEGMVNGEDSREGKVDGMKVGSEERGRCMRSWRPLQGAVVAMAIDSTSTLLATGLFYNNIMMLYYEVCVLCMQVPAVVSKYGTVHSITVPII